MIPIPIAPHLLEGGFKFVIEVVIECVRADSSMLIDPLDTCTTVRSDSA